MVLYVAVLLLLVKPLGNYMAEVYDGKATLALRVGGPLERLIYRCAGVDRACDMRLDRLRAGYALVQPRRGAGRLRDATSPAMAAAESSGHGCGEPGLVVQYRDQLRHQHQLAGLRRREHHELSHPDARAHRSELCVGGEWHGGARCAALAASSARMPTASATSGSISRGRPSTFCCLYLSRSRSCSSRRAFRRRSTRPRPSRCSSPSPTTPAEECPDGQPLKDDKAIR